MKNPLKMLLENAKKRRLIKAMMTSGISQAYIDDLKAMSPSEVQSEFNQFCNSMRG